MIKNNIQIFLRIGPPSTEFTFIDEISKDGKSIKVRHNLSSERFQFDEIFAPQTKQIKVFLRTAGKTIKAVLKGYNGSVIAFGATGSGKTYTVLGSEEMGVQGLLQYSLASLLHLKNRGQLILFSAIQVERNAIRDILNPTAKLQLSKLGINGEIENEKVIQIDDLKNVKQVIDLIKINRRTRVTKVNKVSSRSHAIFKIKILHEESGARSFLQIVDLAGSERLKN